MRYWIIIFTLFASIANAEAVFFYGNTELRPSLRECMSAMEKGNLIREGEKNSSVIAYKGKVFFIWVGIKGMRCAYFEPTHEKK
jgi:hypothetical protein